MFDINENFIDDGTTFVRPKEYALTIEYHLNNNQTKTVKYADQSAFDEAVAKVQDNFVKIGKDYYNPSAISIVYQNGLSLQFTINGGKKITETYASQADLEEALSAFENTHLLMKTRKWYNGKQLHVTDSNKATLTIKYYFDGGEKFTVKYDDEASYDEALEKLAGIGSGTGGGGARTSAPTFTVAPGKVAEGTKFKIECKTEGATIHYTTDGTIPTLDSPVYSGADIEVPEDGITVKAIAVLLGFATSRVTVGQYYTSDYKKPSYKGWWSNTADPLTAITANDLKSLGNLEMAEATKADSPNPNIYTFPEALYPNGGRCVWAYPKEFGEIHYFTDGLGKHQITDSYTKQELTVKGIEYYAYILTGPIFPDSGDEYPLVFTQN